MPWILVAIVPVAAVGLFLLWATSPAVRDAGARSGRAWSSQRDAGAIPPHTGFARSEVGQAGQAGQAEATIAVLTYNVGFASGLANNRPVVVEPETGRKNLHSLMSVLAVQQPDVAGLQEVDGLARRSFYADQARELARAANLDHGAFAPNWNKRYLPYPSWPPAVHYGPVFSGLTLLSRFPIVDHQIVPLPQPSSKGALYRAFYLHRVIQRVQLELPSGGTFTVLNLHLEPFDRENRRRHAEIVAEICAAISEPLIVLGDCNAPPSYATVKSDYPVEGESQDFTEDRTEEILTAGTGLRSVFHRERYLRDENAALTFPSDAPVVTLDYVLHSRHFAAEDASVIRMRAAGSDHLPVAARLRLLSSTQSSSLR